MYLDISEISIVIQLCTALLLGSLLGFERLIAGKEAGMRTFGLVSLGACLFVVVGEVVARSYGDTFNFDPLRLTGSVITGIGFIGAGLIIFQHELRGLTTAAILWVASAIGVAVGFRLYIVAIFTTFLTLFVVVGFWFVERFLESRVHKKKKRNWF